MNEEQGSEKNFAVSGAASRCGTAKRIYFCAFRFVLTGRQRLERADQPSRFAIYERTGGLEGRFKLIAHQNL